MNNKDRRTIVLSVRKLVKGLIQNRKKSTYAIPAFIYRDVVITEELYGGFVSIANTIIRQDDNARKFSANYIFEGICELLSKACVVNNAQKEEILIAEYLDKLAIYSNNTTVYIPLVGIMLPDGPLHVGKAIVRYIEEDDLANVNTSSYIVEDLGVLRDKHIACIIATITAEPKKAIELAIENAHATVSLLMYASFFAQDANDESLYTIDAEDHYIDPMSYYIGIKGDQIPGATNIVIVAPKQIGSHTRMLREWEPFAITDKVRTTFASSGFDKVAALLSEDNPNEFQRTILRAVLWFGNACATTHKPTKLLYLVTCWEAIMNPGKGTNSAVADQVINGVAQVFSHMGKDTSDMVKAAAKYYDLRSLIVHGEDFIITDRQLSDAFHGTAEFIRIVLTIDKQFSTRKEFQKWINTSS